MPADLAEMAEQDAGGLSTAPSPDLSTQDTSDAPLAEGVPAEGAEADETTEAVLPAETAGDEGAEEEDELLAKLAERGANKKLLSKFKSADELVNSYQQLERRIGQVDEDAQWGRAMRQQMGDAALLEMLQGRQAQSGGEATAAGQEADMPTFDEIERLGQDIRTAEAAGRIADPVKQARFDDANRRYLRNAYELARQAEPIRELLDQFRQGEVVTREAYERGQAQAEAVQWVEQHRKSLYVGGDQANELSPFGKMVAAEDLRLKALNTPDGPARWSEAYRRAQERQPSASLAAVSKRSQRQTSVAPKSAPVDEDKFIRDLIEQKDQGVNPLFELSKLEAAAP
uniref:Capsid assembly protein n=1 Tax=viral metagenome TaxID=1070528 RepID=A0A6H1ZNJ5_9ZZZZ